MPVADALGGCRRGCPNDWAGRAVPGAAAPRCSTLRRVHRAGVPRRPGLRGIREVGHRARHGDAEGPAAGQQARRAHVHAVDQGDRGPRPQHRLRRRHRPRGRGSRVGGPHGLPRALQPGGRPRRRRRLRAGRHEVRARLCRRHTEPVRRGVHARLVAPVAGGPGGAGTDPTGVRQATAARLVGRAAGPHTATAAIAGRSAIRQRRCATSRSGERISGRRLDDCAGATP